MIAEFSDVFKNVEPVERGHYYIAFKKNHEDIAYFDGQDWNFIDSDCPCSKKEFVEKGYLLGPKLPSAYSFVEMES